MLEVLTGIGLSTSAGLNAYIPLLTIGLMTRYTDLIDPPTGWQWLSNGWMIAILAVLLAIEVVADKVPAVDHINDVVQTLVRPSAGGLAFGAAASGDTTTISDPSSFLDGQQWMPIVAGIVLAFLVHGAKATARPVINAATFGIGAPVASTVEDVASTVMSIIAIVLPVLVVVLMVGLVWLFWSWIAKAVQRRRSQVE